MEENFANDDLIVKAVVVVGDTEEENKSIGHMINLIYSKIRQVWQISTIVKHCSLLGYSLAGLP